jgi:glycosyltransferase involved in cell wall biosynthesis
MQEEKKILVSIIIPCYNHGAYIEEALNSVEKNNSDDFYEIIIVNDGSNDEATIVTLKNLEERGYQIIHQTNKGLSAARNTAIEHAKGRYILPLDADNMIKPELYRKAIEIMEADVNVSVVYSDCILFGERSEVRPTGEFDIQKMVAGNYIDACGVYRKQVWESNHGYDVDIPNNAYEDWEFWLNAYANGFKFHYIPETLFYYRVSTTGLLRSASNPERRIKTVNYIVEKHSTLYNVHYKEAITSLHGALAVWESSQMEMLQVEKGKLEKVFHQLLHDASIKEADKIRAHYDEALLAHQNSFNNEMDRIKKVAIYHLSQVELKHKEQLTELHGVVQQKDTMIAELESARAQLKSTIDLLHQEISILKSYQKQALGLIANYEQRIKDIEGTRTWKIRKNLLKFKGYFKPSSAKKKFRIPGLGFLKKIFFFTLGKGKIITRRFFKKIFKTLYIWLEEFPVRIIPVTDAGNATYQLNAGDPYHQWMLRNFPRESEFREYKKNSENFAQKPLISIILPVYNPPEELFRQTIHSVLGQIYENWELCIADDASTNKRIKEMIDEFAKNDFRIKVEYRKENGHISKASNSALALATGEYTLLLDHDDLLSADCIYHVVDAINNDNTIDLLYSDEDKIDENGVHSVPHFKPKWCPDHFTSRNYLGHVVVCRTSILNQIGGFRAGFEGSQDYDMLLRFIEKTQNIHHIPRVLYHWRIHKASAAHSEEAKPYAYIAAQNALTEHFDRIGQPAKVDFLPGFRGYSIRYNYAKGQLISIIIPTKDNAEVLKVCIDSIFEKSTYQNFEIIVISNNSKEKALFELLDQYAKKYPTNFAYWEHNIPFNFSKLMNFGREKAKGDYLLLLNNDTEVITVDWMESMVEQVQRPEVGVAGVKLLYPDNTIQHAGVVIGLGGIAGHTFVGMHKDEAGYFNYIQSINNYSALTAACLMVKVSDYDKVGGFNEEFEVEYNDVDFCLKLKELGLNNVYLPHVELYHYESLTRGHPHMNKESYARHIKELDLFKANWQKYIDDDPCYNIHLTRGAHDFRLAL